jgi:hypothetical protein
MSAFYIKNNPIKLELQVELQVEVRITVMPLKRFYFSGSFRGEHLALKTSLVE